MSAAPYPPAPTVSLELPTGESYQVDQAEEASGRRDSGRFAERAIDSPNLVKDAFTRDDAEDTIWIRHIKQASPFREDSSFRCRRVLGLRRRHMPGIDVDAGHCPSGADALGNPVKLPDTAESHSKHPLTDLDPGMSKWVVHSSLPVILQRTMRWGLIRTSHGFS